MKVQKITLHLIEQKLVSPFESRLERVENRESILVEIEDEDGVIGWGEVVAFSSPWYTEETINTAWHMIEDFLAQVILQENINHPNDVQQMFKPYKRNLMAKAGLETAIWDLYAKKQGIPLSVALGGTREKIQSGVVVGLGEIESVLAKIKTHITEGYKRIKIKIKPGMDYEYIKAIRTAFPTVPLMADANSAYSLDNIEDLKALDQFDLMMIEQPLASDDIFDHAKLQRELSTPICLDESIVTYDDARQTIEMGSCKVINIKVGRVGGLSEAIRIHDLCERNNIPVWCGGMLETGISRAHNVALASLSNFTIPGDISASSRYWTKDIITPEVVVNNGYIEVPKSPGIGFEVNRELLTMLTKEWKVMKKCR